jgi:putative transposase
MYYGSEFISKVIDKWAYERGVEMDFSRPGKPTGVRSTGVAKLD